MRDTPISLELYRWLLRLYPAGFLENYAGPMEREFRDELAERSGACAVAATSIGAATRRIAGLDIMTILRTE